MSKPPPQGQNEEACDLGSEADNALIVNQILKQLVWDDLEDLEDGELHSRKHSRKKQASDAQREMLEEVTQSIWGALQNICSTTNLGSLQLTCVDTQKKQEALNSAIKDGKVNKEFLAKFILRSWEAIRDERKQNKKHRTSPPSNPSPPKKRELHVRKWAPEIQHSTGGTTTESGVSVSS